MTKKTLLKDELQKYLINGKTSDTLKIVIDNAILKLDEKVFNEEKAKEYILDWALKLKENGTVFTEYEASLYYIVKPVHKKRSLANSFSWSIINIFK